MKESKLPRNSRKSATTTESWSAIQSGLSRGCNWAGPTRCQGIKPRHGLPIRIFSISGRMLTRTFPSSNKQSANTPGCGDGKSFPVLDSPAHLEANNRQTSTTLSGKLEPGKSAVIKSDSSMMRTDQLDQNAFFGTEIQLY